MQLELNSNVSGLSHTWQNAKGFKPVHGAYYLAAVFNSGSNELDEIFIVLGVGGKYFHMDKARFIDLDRLHENHSHTVLIHPVPSLSTEVSEV